MSRVLKFRAWDKKKNRWAREWDRELENQEDPVYEKEYSEDSYWLDGDVASDLDLVNGRLNLGRYVWEQYTGLSDKNGIPIYEGDIVEFHRINPYKTYREPVSFGEIQDGEGYYHDTLLAWRTTYPNGDCHQSLYDLAMTPEKIGGEFLCEVIGNIHENKELWDDSEK